MQERVMIHNFQSIRTHTVSNLLAIYDVVLGHDTNFGFLVRKFGGCAIEFVNKNG